MHACFFFSTVLLNDGFEASPAAVRSLQSLFSFLPVVLLVLGSERRPALRQRERAGERALQPRCRGKAGLGLPGSETGRRAAGERVLPGSCRTNDQHDWQLSGLEPKSDQAKTGTFHLYRVH